MTVPYRLRILLSYWYYKDQDLDALLVNNFREPYPEIFADSGGFSAWSQGATIDWREYGGWLKRWRHLFSVRANLDVIGNPAETRENQKRLEDAGLAVLPVYHTGEPLSELEYYLRDYSYIALGGMVPHMRYTKRIMPWLIQAFKVAQGQAVFHGFGCTSWNVLKSLPFYSVDSSSWGSGYRYGQVPVFDAARGKFVTVRLGNRREWLAVSRLVRGLGFDPADFWDRARNDRAKIAALSAVSFMQAERWLRHRHGDVVIPRQAGAGPGARVYLVDGSVGNLAMADAGVKMYFADARPSSGSEVAAADTGVKMYLVDTAANQYNNALVQRIAIEKGIL